MPGILVDPTRMPVPVTGMFPNDAYALWQAWLQRERGNTPTQQTRLGPVPGLLDTQNAAPRPPGALLQPVGDVIRPDVPAWKGLLDPNQVQDVGRSLTHSPLGPGELAPGGANVMQFPFRMLDNLSKTPPASTVAVPPGRKYNEALQVQKAAEASKTLPPELLAKINRFADIQKSTPAERANAINDAATIGAARKAWESYSESSLKIGIDPPGLLSAASKAAIAARRAGQPPVTEMKGSQGQSLGKHYDMNTPEGRAAYAKDTAQTSFGEMPLRPTAKELSAVKRNARAKSNAYKAGKKGEINPANFGRWADKVNPTQQSAVIDAQLAGNARALSEISMKQAKQAENNKWSAFAHKQGWDTNKAVIQAANIVTQFLTSGKGVPPDSLIKFMLAQTKQRGEW